MGAADVPMSLKGKKDTEASSPPLKSGEEQQLRPAPLGNGGPPVAPPPSSVVAAHEIPELARTFPEKLMQLMAYAEERGKDDPNFCVAWTPDGKSFMVRDQETFNKEIIPLFYKRTKFSAFTRKLYRWGFRQINRGAAIEDPQIFGNVNFQRDNKALIANMRSVTSNISANNNSSSNNRGSVGVGNSSDFLNGGMSAEVALEIARLRQQAQAQFLQMQSVASISADSNNINRGGEVGDNNSGSVAGYTISSSAFAAVARQLPRPQPRL